MREANSEQYSAPHPPCNLSALFSPQQPRADHNEDQRPEITKTNLGKKIISQKEKTEGNQDKPSNQARSLPVRGWRGRRGWCAGCVLHDGLRVVPVQCWLIENMPALYRLIIRTRLSKVAVFSRYGQMRPTFQQPRGPSV